MGAVRAMYPEINPSVSLKALSYFGDVADLSEEIQWELSAAASKAREIAQISKLDDLLLPGSDSIAKERDIEFERDLEIWPQFPSGLEN